MKGGFGCSPCCGPTCDECTRECTNPHTGDPFEVVYSYKFEGVEAGNPTDGYLTATGDADSSDPYDGMDGNGPWTQAVSADFNYTPSTTRFPCWVRVSFWRSQFLLGAATTPAPSEALDSQTITITNNGSGDIWIHGEFDDATVIKPGDSYTGTGIPLVSGSGDQSTNRPRFYEGVVAFRPACGNDSVNVTVTAEISWSVKKRQHILYGIVLECYEESPPAGCCPAGSTLLETVYCTISGYSYPGGVAATSGSVNGTYVLDRLANFCNIYRGDVSGACAPSFVGVNDDEMFVNFLHSVTMYRWTPSGAGGCVLTYLQADEPAIAATCNSGSTPISSGTGKVYRFDGSILGQGGYTQVGTFSWSIDD